MAMKKVSATYKAPPGDNKVLEAYGHTFFDGKAEEIELDEVQLAKMQGNRMFECGEPSDVDPSERDEEKEKAAAEAAKVADDAKRIAQGGPPPARGAVLKSEDYRTEEEKAADEKAAAEQAEAATGEQPKPANPKPAEPKPQGAGQEARNFPQAGRDK